MNLQNLKQARKLIGETITGNIKENPTFLIMNLVICASHLDAVIFDLERQGEENY